MSLCFSHFLDDILSLCLEVKRQISGYCKLIFTFLLWMRAWIQDCYLILHNRCQSFACCCSLNVCINFYYTLHFSTLTIKEFCFFMVPLKIIILYITWKDNALNFNENRSKFIFLGVIGWLGVLPAKFNVWPNFMIHSGGVCRWAVNTWNSGSGGPGFKPCPWHYCFLRQGTLLHFASLHPGV